MTRARRLTFLFLIAFAVPVRADGTPPAADFERDVYPVLKARCFSCHDAKKQKAGLRLDVRSAAFKGGESGKPAVVPGKPAESDLVRRIASEDDDTVMPPTGDRLTKEQIGKITAWVAAGAKWPDALANEGDGRKHWAFVPPQRPAVPEVQRSNPIDAFVLARLKKEGLSPSPVADPVTLCRRLYLDLIGLPPTPDEVDAFVADRSPDAYRKLVEKLLASPHYGERWGRLWLDAARYADSDGFEKDKPRAVWFYRDWVINAFSRDLPFDRFVTEQIAGDLLPGAGQEQKVATGFLRNSMINEEGGVDPEQFRMEAMFDRMDAVGKGVLGLTIQCAQCHTHKYDPITHTEYYRLFAFLNNAHEAQAAVYAPDEQMKRADLFRRIAEAEADLKHKHPDWADRLAAWEKEAVSTRPVWRPLSLAVVVPESTGGAKYVGRADASMIQEGYAPTKHRVHLSAAVPAGQAVAGFRLDLLPDPTLPRGGPGRSVEGTGALTEFEVEYAPANDRKKTVKVKFTCAAADTEMADAPLKPIYDDRSKKTRILGPAAYAIDGKDETAWGHDIDPVRRNHPRAAVFVPEKPIPAFPEGTVLNVFLKQNHGGWNSDDNQNCNLGRFRLSVTDAADPIDGPVPPSVEEALAVPAADRSPAQAAAVFAHWRTTVPEWKKENEAIAKLWKEMPEGTTQLVLQEREPGAGRATHLLKRGDFLKPADAVTPGVPAFLHPLPADAPPNRVGFARWLTDRNSPTTARALVNRVWQAYFGAGLVGTPEDFGTQAEPPTHAELLDWLAVEVMEPTKPTDSYPWALPDAQPWSLKHLHRLIVLSETYRQSSKVTPDLARRDPQNKLLARGPRFRVDAEVVRDIALSASGLLTPAVGGPSVYPPIPEFLTKPPASYGPKVWPESTGQDRYRRSLYVFRFRSIPYPPLAAFDAPTGDFACVKRPRSNSPIQALTGLNEPIFLEAARALGLKALASGGPTDADKAAWAFRRCVSRAPTTAELDVLLGLYAKQKERFETPAADPWAVAFPNPDDYRKLPNAATPAQAAAWVAVARAVLNLDETVTKE